MGKTITITTLAVAGLMAANAPAQAYGVVDPAPVLTTAETLQVADSRRGGLRYDVNNGTWRNFWGSNSNSNSNSSSNSNSNSSSNSNSNSSSNSNSNSSSNSNSNSSSNSSNNSSSNSNSNSSDDDD